MAKQLQLRRGTTAQHSTFTGAVGEVTIDTDKDVVVVHDGATAGGFPSQKQLVSGTNIKTVNSTTLLGSGNIAVQPTLVSGTNIKTINSSSILASGNLDLVAKVSSIEGLASLDGTTPTVIVTDLDRGGIFVWSASGTANGGTVFAGSSGYWIRQYSGAVNVKWFGAKGDGVTDDTEAMYSAISSGLLFIDNNLTQKINITKTVDIFGENSENFLRFIKEPESSAVAGTVAGIVIQSIGSDANRIKSAVIKNLSLTMPFYSSLSGGTANNHFVIALANADNVKVSDVRVDSSDLALNVSYGDIRLTERGCKYTQVVNFTGERLRGMGLQLFNSQYGSFNNLSFSGDTSVGKAMFHGVRLTALSTFPNKYNTVHAIVENFVTGVSLQSNSFHNEVNIVGKNLYQGIQVHGHSESVPESALSKYNSFKITASDIENHGVITGGSYNTFDVDLVNTGAYGIYETPQQTSTWCSLNNTYKGRIVSPTTRGAEFSGVGAKIDLYIQGKNTTDTTFGIVINGTKVTGTAVIKNCAIGCRINSDNNNLNLEISECIEGLVIAGSNNIVYLNTALPISIGGSNNKVIGKSGSITNTGSNNDLSELNRTSFYSRYYNMTSDANGYIVVTHNSGIEGFFAGSVFGNNGYHLQPYTSTANSVTFRLFDVSGVRVANATGLILMLSITSS